MSSALQWALVLLASLVAVSCQDLSPQELECMSKAEFYHQPTGKCYPLLRKGPCPDGQWFVLRKPLETDKANVIKAVCVDDVCGEDGIYWPKKGCLTSSAERRKVCEVDPLATLNYNDFGEAECACPKSPPHARLNDSETNLCYPLHSRGPCPTRHILAVTEGSTVPACIEDPCYNDAFTLKSAGKLAKTDTLAKASDGKCYQLGTQGPCPKKDHLWQVSLVEQKPACVELTRTIFDLEKKPDCVKDETGQCLQIIHLNNDGSEYRRMVVAQLIAYRERHRKLVQVVVEDEIDS